MTEQIQKSLRDSKTARWFALTLVSLTMFFAYFFVDVAAPLKGSLERYFGWSNEQFGWLGGSEFILNVMGFLILSGIILDKMGIRFTLRTSALAMLIGGGLKFYALSFIDIESSVNIFSMTLPTTALMSYVGFAIFGIGVEMAGITVSKTLVKWFKGKELAMAMGLEMAIARLGVFAVFQLSPKFAGITEATPYGTIDGVRLALIVAMAFIAIGALCFIIYTFLDAKLDKQTGETSEADPEDEFKFSDLGKILTNPGFITIAGLCVLFYSAIFPFQKFAAEMLSSKLDVSMDVGSSIFSWFPIGAMILTPIIGFFLDRKGLGASAMIFGACLLVVSHLIFALVPEESFNMFTAVVTIVVLGTAFSLVPASMWPSVPKIIEEKLLGSAYGLIFWIQNIGLMAVPVLIGWSLTASNPGVAEAIAAGDEAAKYNYTMPEFIFAGFGVLAIILAFVLKRIDKKKGYGLELPNIQK